MRIRVEILQSVYRAGDIAAAESVVDIDDAHVGSATIQHRQQRGQPAETCSVAHAGRHGDHRHSDQTGDDARQRSFHSRDTHDDARRRDFFVVLQQPMQAGDANVVHAFNLVPHGLRRKRCLLRHGNVARARRDDKDRAFANDLPVAANADDSGKWVKFGLSIQSPDSAVDGRIGACDQNVVRRPRAQHSAHDRDDLLRCFPLGINHLGKTLTQSAVVIDLGEPKVLERHVPQPLDTPRDGQFPCPHIFQEPLNVLFVHLS